LKRKVFHKNQKEGDLMMKNKSIPPIKQKKHLIVLLAILWTFFMISSHTFSQDTLAYLGQPPPGNTAVLFPPDSLLSNTSWFWHGPPVFSPDLHEMHWNKYVIYSPSFVRLENFYMKVENGQWSSPQRPACADTSYHEKNPFLSADGNSLYFISEGRPGGYIFKSMRTGNSWSPPSPLSISCPTGRVWGGQFSVAADNSIFLDFDIVNVNNSFNIFLAKWNNSQYVTTRPIGPPINTDNNDYMPFIDPDWDYMVFSSNRPGGYGGTDLYVSFMQGDSSWTDPVNLGPQINAAQFEGWPYVSPDKKYLFFVSHRPETGRYNPYWISTSVIENLRPPLGIKNRDHPLTKGFALHQNYPNPFNPRTTIEFNLPKSSQVTLKIFNIHGEIVATVLSTSLLAGSHSVKWDASNMASGVYLYRLRAGEPSLSTGQSYVETRKMVLMR
jgi:hypothetical protein